MAVQVIKNIQGEDEYVLLPIAVYERFQEQLDAELSHYSDFQSGEITADTEYGEDTYKHNPITLMRLRAGMKQKDLAEQLNVTQAYVSKLENSDRVSERVLARVRKAIQKRAIEKALL